MILRTACLTLLLSLTLAPTYCRAAEDLAKKWYPATAKAPITPQFVLVADEAGDDEQAKAWGEEAKRLCDQWFPIICQLLDTEDWTPPERVELVLKKQQDAPGVTIGQNIYISMPWIKSHPEDFGMVIHELTHVVQSYPRARNKPGWLVEGIADYIRYWKYEAERPRYPLNRDRAKYTDGYNNTAAFLAFLTWKYDRRIVPKLDGALRGREYNEKMFEELTGKSLDDLWADFMANNPMA
ncbi:basic secretory family protein [Blastopirellula sp. JC732]|uniref:Basic secretory family protein n=1 Tax=Blastopirellula sediminis TaxID=2894196 RepID=A0A9X1MNX6_9BACT|nr:basic secretory family protein [Blastopirellula sediminis]MCC9606973.1 basic secretory family protein [Blastopirellula sediminis]MCC9629732.1 basic secretory family protein [Blastopirellula sediminis]